MRAVIVLSSGLLAVGLLRAERLSSSCVACCVVGVALSPAHSCGSCGTVARVQCPTSCNGDDKEKSGKTTQQQLSYKFHPSRSARSPTVIRGGPLRELTIDILVISAAKCRAAVFRWEGLCLGIGTTVTTSIRRRHTMLSKSSASYVFCRNPRYHSCSP